MVRGRFMSALARVAGLCLVELCVAACIDGPCAHAGNSCPADIAPAAGNGTVDVNDLLAVINNWGFCAAPCPPRCASDIMPLLAGNCATDVDDLLAVINAWGACPCNPSGSWASSPPAAYQCAFGLVSFNITQWTMNQSATTLFVSGAPVMMTGSAVTCAPGQTFSVSGTLAGSCQETYALTGTFASATQFSATFSATFTPSQSGACLDCTNRQFNVTATRVP